MDTVEQVFSDVAKMTPELPGNDDPYQSEEYAKFVESMIPFCHCSESRRPCDGLLCGGSCDHTQDPRSSDEITLPE